MHTTIKRQVAKFYFIILLGLIVSLTAAGIKIILPEAKAATGLQIRGVDVMKFTKDVMRNQPSDAEINNIVSSITSTIKPTHISISVPLDNSGDYPADHTPSPRDAYAFAKAWTDSIHSKNTSVLFRGTFSGIEGIYDFEKKVGDNRFPAGTAQSAEADGNRTWLGKIYNYIISNPGQFKDGDIWAPLPERTENIFNDDTSFLPHDGQGIQGNYQDFFIDLKKVSDAAFAKIGKRVLTGYTANNYTEIASTWIYPGLFDETGIIAIDHYGSDHTPEEMEADIRKIHGIHNKPVFLQEWGDYWNEGMGAAERMQYLDTMYGVWQKLINEGILTGFNYWGGWPGDHEGILEDTGNGTYAINERGQRLAAFFAANSQSPAPSQHIAGSTKTVNTNASPSVILPENSREGDVVKFGDNPTIYLTTVEGLFPFHSWPDYVSYQASNPKNLRMLSGPQAQFTIKEKIAADIWPFTPHENGAWILHEGTAYYVSKDGPIGVPSVEILNSNGGRLDALLAATVADTWEIQNSNNPPMEYNDPRGQ